MTDSLRRLHEAVSNLRNADPAGSKTARLLHAGPAKNAKKIAEEAVEVALAAMARDHGEIVRESADLIYHLVVLWVEAGVQPHEIWAEMERREQLFGIAGKLPKTPAGSAAPGGKVKVAASAPRRRQAR
jgi:phosphoribosyl-ATP pyrophosphohydrolase